MSPAAFPATTGKVYAVPLVSPVTVQLVVGCVAVQVLAPGVDVTVYVVSALPPFELGADQDTVTCVLPATPLTAVGAVGAPMGVTVALGAEGALWNPAAFDARTVKV